MFDLSRLGGWATLPFFTEQWPALAAQLDNDILPPPSLTFAALERTQPDATKVIIIGQDPEHGDGVGRHRATEHLAGGPVDDLGGAAQVHAHSQHGAFAHDHAFGDFGAGADEAIVLDDHRIGL